MDNILGSIGMALRAGRLAVGEEPTAAACAEKDCRLLLVARDAAESTNRHAVRWAEEGQCLRAVLPYGKEELGRSLGRAQCAVTAVTEWGFALSIAEKLAAVDAETYGVLVERLRVKTARVQSRRATRGSRPRKKK